MKIHSKFKDYYDIGLAFGVDDSYHWVRETTELAINNPIYNEYHYKDNDNHYISKEPFIRYAPEVYGFNNDVAFEWLWLGFCGKIYPCIEVITSTKLLNRHEYVWGIADFNKLLKSISSKKNNYFDKFNNSANHSYRANASSKQLSDYFTKYSGKLIDSKAFINSNTPVFVVKLEYTGSKLKSYNRKWHYITNPRLVDISFQKVLDPYTTYQEIDMYLSGVIGNTEVDTVDISDTDMRDAKGFNDMSFKKCPTKRNKHRRNC